jgi:ATP-dependent Clp protease protease subunit
METKALAVQAKKKDTGAECWLYGDIGGFEGITADAFRKAIDDLGDFKSLVMYVNSPGGSVFDGKAIVAQLERIRQSSKVTAVVDGLAASAASFIAVSCDEVVMHASAKMMVHMPYAIAAGGATDFRKMADLLDSESESLVAIYQKKTGMKPAELRKMLEDETWMTAEEAVSNKFADRIAGATKPKNETSLFTDLVAKTKAITNTDEVKRQAALSRAQRVVETMRAKDPRTTQAGETK